jgi:hypothetical protein
LLEHQNKLLFNFKVEKNENLTQIKKKLEEVELKLKGK